MYRKHIFVILLAIVFVFCGFARAETIEIVNFSFEYDVNGDPFTAGWINGVDTLLAWWPDVNWCYDCSNGMTQNSASEGTYSVMVENVDSSLYQVLSHTIEAEKRYVLVFDAANWANTACEWGGVLARGAIFYPEDANYPDANHVTLAGVIFDTPCVELPATWYYDLTVGFIAETGGDYIGKNIGVKIGFPYVEQWQWSLMDNVRLDMVDRGVAWRPSPADGAVNVTQPVELVWSPGDLVQSTAGHKLYLGTDYNDVNERLISPIVLDVNSYSPGPLLWQQTYYWAVDEVNGIDSWPGAVWSFTVVGAKASEPSPANNAEDVSPLAVLSWVPGGETVSHELYLSTDFNDVNERLISPEIPGANSYDPGGLAMAKQYYWAVDEVNMSSATPRWYGDVWTFETEWYRVVDDMDSYVEYTNDIFNTWLQGSELDSAALIDLQTELSDANLVRSGNSMKFTYRNSIKVKQLYGSETAAWTSELEIGSNWMAGDSKALVLYFYGQSGNAIGVNDQMFVALEDSGANVGVVYYDGEANDVQEEQWNEWNIELSDANFSGVDLNDVSRVYIGFGIHGGDGSAVGGNGVVYFDDIRVYPSRCRSEMVAADFNWNCVIDIWDLWLIAHRWLETEGEVTATPAPTSNTEGLVVWYNFEETDGTTAYDSSGNDYDGVVSTSVAWDPTAGYDGDGCLNFAGDVDVEIPNDAWSFPLEAITVSMWLQPNPLPLPVNPADIACPFGAGDDGDYWMLVMMYLSIDWATSEQLPGHDIEFRTSYEDMGGWNAWDEIIYHDPNANGWVGWHHYAFVKDSGNNLQSIYRDGELMAWNWWGAGRLIQPIDPSNDTFYLGYSGSVEWEWGRYTGWMDDFRVYDHALAHSQIVDLAGKSSVDQAFLSDEDKIDANQDHVINFGDYSIMADNWLTEILWP